VPPSGVLWNSLVQFTLFCLNEHICLEVKQHLSASALAYMDVNMLHVVHTMLCTGARTGACTDARTGLIMFVYSAASAMFLLCFYGSTVYPQLHPAITLQASYDTT